MYVLYLFSGQSIALEYEIDSEIEIQPKTLIQLSKNPTWIKLVHYDKNSTNKSNYLSTIHSLDFFNSKNGNNDPYNELISTIKAFQIPIENFTDPNLHALCKFPARAMWLQEYFPIIRKNRNKIICSDYNKWTLNNSTESISLIYVTGYLGNPASFYGHVLLKMNSNKISNRTALEDISINYGALIPDNEDPVSYIIKGVFGGYDAAFSHVDYYYHDHNYGEVELRDIWEYKLNLTKKETEFIVAHEWEILGKKYTYYFLKQNCAYRMGELLELIDGVSAIPDNNMYTFPQSLVKTIASAHHNGRNLVEKVIYHPSRQSRFYQKIQSLSKAEKLILTQIISNTEILHNDVFTQRNLISKQKIIDTMIDYYQYLIKRNEEENNTQLKLKYKSVLTERFKLPVGQPKISTKDKTSPAQGRDPSYASISYLNNRALGNLINLKLRPAYYDQLDSSAGHVKHSSLSMFELNIKFSQNDFYLNSLDLFSVKSINNNATGLPGDSGFAWNLKAGIEQTNSTTTNKLVFKLHGDMGESLRLNKNILLIGYLGGGLQNKKNGYGNSYANVSATTLIDISPKLNLLFDYKYQYFINGQTKNRKIIRFEGRYQLSKEWDARIHYLNDGNFESGVSIGYYW